MEIKKIDSEQTTNAIALIWETFLQFEAPDYSDEGVHSFRNFIEDKTILKSLEFFGAYENEELKGIIATNDNRKHICCFFVKAQYHRQGIGKKLWEYLLNNSINETFTVNSSPYAVPVYHKLGFVDADSEQLTDGIRYTPMKFKRQLPVCQLHIGSTFPEFLQLNTRRPHSGTPSRKSEKRSPAFFLPKMRW